MRAVGRSLGYVAPPDAPVAAPVTAHASHIRAAIHATDVPSGPSFMSPPTRNAPGRVSVRSVISSAWRRRSCGDSPRCTDSAETRNPARPTWPTSARVASSRDHGSLAPGLHEANRGLDLRPHGTLAELAGAEHPLRLRRRDAGEQFLLLGAVAAIHARHVRQHQEHRRLDVPGQDGRGQVLVHDALRAGQPGTVLVHGNAAAASRDDDPGHALTGRARGPAPPGWSASPRPLGARRSPGRPAWRWRPGPEGRSGLRSPPDRSPRRRWFAASPPAAAPSTPWPAAPAPHRTSGTRPAGTRRRTGGGPRSRRLPAWPPPRRPRTSSRRGSASGRPPPPARASLPAPPGGPR